MHIALIDSKGKSKDYFNKEMNGGLGRKIVLDTSIRSLLLNACLKKLFYTPPISLAYIGAVFEERGFSVSLHNDALIPQETHTVIFQTSIANYKTDIELAKRIRKISPSTLIGFTGSFPTFCPEYLVDDCDFILSGEPENICKKLFDTISPEGIIKDNEVVDIDSLPYPKWDMFLNNKGMRGNIRGLPIYSSRGCAFSCSYCPYLAFFGRTRTRKPETFIQELQFIVKKYGIKKFLFRDPDFTENRKRTIAILDLIIESDLGINWSCETRLDLLDKDLLNHMKRAGCNEIGVGIESPNPEILKAVNRREISKTATKELIDYGKKIGVLIQGNYIIALPEDTDTTISETLQYSHYLNTPLANFSVFTPYPGTKSWNTYKSKITENDMEKFDLSNLVFEHNNLTSDTVSQLFVQAYHSYYFRFSWLLSSFPHIVKSVIKK